MLEMPMKGIYLQRFGEINVFKKLFFNIQF
jgi:hypothetical protein